MPSVLPRRATSHATVFAALAALAPPAALTTLAALAALAAALAGCERSTPAPRGDTTPAVATAPESAAAPAAAPLAWDESAGPVLVVAGDTPDSAVIVFPQYTDSTLADTTTFDGSAVRDARVDLFSRAGSVGTARLSALRPPHPDEECTAWPHAAVKGADGTARAWTVAFVSGRAQPIPLDSIEAAPGRDSAYLAAEAARVAFLLPNDTARAFRGIPFAVRTVRRFKAAPGVDAFVADVVRKINQEANPREERIVLVAERDSGATSGHYTPAYSERVSGAEDALETTEVLAAVALGTPRRPTLVLARDDGEGGTFSLLERAAPKRWRVRWTSAYAGC